ncbi:MAG: hypothetical protein IIY32_05920, partial [Thermoguttaceae bacterium]|nr:hypothetical protein [Thermoguttaceae bacterium]
ALTREQNRRLLHCASFEEKLPSLVNSPKSVSCAKAPFLYIMERFTLAIKSKLVNSQLSTRLFSDGTLIIDKNQKNVFYVSLKKWGTCNDSPFFIRRRNQLPPFQNGKIIWRRL